MAGRFMLLGSLIYALLFLGLVTVNGGPLALALPLIIYLGAALLHHSSDVNLIAARTLSVDSVRQFEPVKVSLQITNHGVDLEEVLVEDQLPAGLELVDGEDKALTSLASGETLVLEYTVRGRRGTYQYHSVRITTSDHLGVMNQQMDVAAKASLIYMPETGRLGRIAIRPPRTHGHSGPIPSRKSGAGVEFHGLREYQMGDPRRWINWRASARHQQDLYVNQFEQERIADVGIILDARQQADIVLPGGESLFEYSVQAAASLAEAFLSDGNRVGLLVYGFGLHRTFPGYGKVQLERILRSLGLARTGHNFALESLRYLPTRFFPAGSQLVMISPLMESDVTAITRLRANGYELLVVSPDPIDFEARYMGIKDGLAHELARIERSLLIHRVQRLGVRLLEWQVNQPFGPLVRNRLGRVPAVRPMVNL
jgi:uncharacterized protein (DUF58 family)